MQKTACFFNENGHICWMKSDFLLMSVLLSWQKGADQKIYAGDGCVTPETLEI